MRTLYLFLLLSSFLVVEAVYRHYQNCQIFDHEKIARLHWSIENDKIRIGMEAKVDTFFAFAVSADKNLLSSNEDFVDAWVVSFEGECAVQGCLHDSYILGDGTIVTDDKNDMEDVFVYRQGDSIVAEFTRKLNTKDTKDYPINSDGQLLFWSTSMSSKNLLEIDGSFLLQFFESVQSCEVRDPIVGRVATSVVTSAPVTSAVTSAPVTSAAASSAAANTANFYNFGSVQLSYTLDTTKTKIIITMTGTTGWVSIGYKLYNGNMAACDMAVGWVDDNTLKPYLYDVYSSGYSTPPDDTTIGGTDDVTLISAQQVNGQTTIVYSRLLVTPDTVDDQAITMSNAGSLYLEWAYAAGDGTAGPPLYYPIHPPTTNGGGGSLQVNVFTGVAVQSFLLSPGEILLLVSTGFILVWLVIRLLYRCSKWVGRQQAKKKSGYKSGPVTWAQSISAAPTSSPVSVDERETKVIPREPAERTVPPPPFGMRPGGPSPPDPLRPRLYGNSPLPVQNNTFTGSYYRGSSVVYPRQTQQKTASRLRKEEIRRSQVQVKVVKDDSQRKADAAVLKEKSTGKFYTQYFSYTLNWRFPFTQITLGFFLTVLIFVGINVGAFFQYMDAYYSIGSLTAANGLLVALPANRNGLMSWLLGISFDRTILYHRWLGRFTIFLGLLHWILSWVYYAQQNGNNLMMGLQQISLTNANNFGYVSYGAMVIIFFTSLEYIRRRRYELFYYLHYFFVIFYLFGALHSYEMANYCIAGVIIYLIDRIIRILYGALPMKTIKLNYKEGDIVQIVFAKNSLIRWLKLYKVGQYVFLNFPTLSPLEWHPFSVSSGPDENILEVHIKGLGDHTRQIVAAAKLKASMWVRVDGPYGDMKLNYRRFPVFFLAAGGIGVTPVIGILKDIFRYGELDPMAKKRHKSLVEKVYFIWTVQNMQQFAWFSEELKYFLEASKKGNSLPDFEAHVFVTKGEVEGPNATENYGTFHKGRPDFEGIFGKLCNDHKEKASIAFTCGPRRLVNDCWDAVSDQQRKGAVIHFHHETFEF